MRRTRIVRIVRRLIPSIRVGTESYSEKTARRLRAFNIAVWITAMVPGPMALVRFFDGKLAVGFVDVVVATLYASMPLLHRLGPLVAPIAFASVSYAVIFWVNFLVGTNGGTSLGYFTTTALSILIIGTEHYLIGAAFGIISIALAITTELVLPRDSGFVSSTFLIVTNYAISVAFTSTVLYGIIVYAVRQMERAEAIAEREFRRSEALLTNILPPSIAARLKGSTSAIADAYPEASILFADMAGFTARASDTSPEDLVHFLNSVYTRIDNIVERHGLEKIKTSGDAYVVVSGVPKALPDHACAIADLSLDIRDALSGLVDPRGRAVPVRIGIASGPVVAGVVGRRKFFHDVWGDAVNTASPMESTGEIGQIQVAPDTRELIASRFDLKERGIIEVRGKGPMRTWFLVGRKPAIAESSVEPGRLGRSNKISAPFDGTGPMSLVVKGFG